MCYSVHLVWTVQGLMSYKYCLIAYDIMEFTSYYDYIFDGRDFNLWFERIWKMKTLQWTPCSLVITTYHVLTVTYNNAHRTFGRDDFIIKVVYDVASELCPCPMLVCACFFNSFFYFIIYLSITFHLYPYKIWDFSRIRSEYFVPYEPTKILLS